MASSAFDCEVIFVYRGMKSDCWPVLSRLRNPEIREFGGRPFLSGSLLTRGGDHWASGKLCHIPFDGLAAIVEIGSYEEFLQRESTMPPPQAS